MDSYIVKVKDELRPCYANGKKAFFHKLYEKDLMICNSLSCKEIEKKILSERDNMRKILQQTGGFIDKEIPFEKMRVTVALVEYENGKLEEINPSEIRFTDTAALMEQYDFSCSTDDFLNKKFNFPKDDEAARKALEKQIPKKPALEGDGYDDAGNLIYDTGYCPNCNESYEVDYHTPKYCESCGQALDWSAESEGDK